MKASKSIPVIVLFLLICFAGIKLNQQVAAKSHQNNQVGTVIRVADGDTLTVALEDGSGKEEKIRLCGIDAPEKAQDLGLKSKALLTKLALNKRVSFEPIERDRYGRTVAEVFVLGDSEVFVNGDMVQNGLAYHYDKYSHNCPNQGAIVEAERIAKSKHAGVWSRTDAVKPWDFRRQQRTH